jgi:hypothetical protein
MAQGCPGFRSQSLPRGLRVPVQHGHQEAALQDDGSGSGLSLDRLLQLLPEVPTCDPRHT